MSLRTAVGDRLPLFVLLGVTSYLLVAQLVLNLAPLTSLALLLAVLVGVILILRPIWAFYLLVASFSAETVLGIAGVLTATKLLGAVVFGTWCLEGLFRRSYRVPRAPILAAVPVFLVWVMICLVVVEDMRLGLERLGTITQLCLLVFVSATIVKSRRDIERLGWVIVGSLGASALYGIVQFLRGSQAAVEGFGFNRNAIGTYMAMCVPMLVYFFSWRKLGGRIALLPLVALLLMAEVLSFSRGGFIVFSLTLGLSLLLVPSGHRTTVLMALLLLFLLLMNFIPQEYWDRVSGIRTAITQGTDTMGTRYELWGIAVRIVEENPWFGAGPGNYFRHFMRHSGIWGLVRDPLVSHNAYLGVATETGIPGALLYITLLFLGGLGYLRAGRASLQAGDRRLAALSLTLGLMLLVFAVVGLKGAVQHMKYMWMLLGLSAAMDSLVKRAGSEGSSEGERAPSAKPGLAVPSAAT